MRSKIFIIILLVFGFATRFLYFGYPDQVVFDEVYFGKYALEYTAGTYYFDPHPPLAKMLLGSMKLLSPTTLAPEVFQTIGNQYPNETYAYLRLLPSFLGALLPLLVYLLAKRLFKSENAAFVAGLLTVFETMFIVQSRFIFIDIFLVFFGLLGLLFYFYFRSPDLQKNTQKSPIIFLILGIVFTGLAACVKWTGISYIALIGLVEIFYLIKDKARFTTWLQRAILFIIIPSIFYISFFAIHFALLPKTGEGDVFMTPQFQKTLEGSQYQGDQSFPAVSFKDKLFEIHKAIFDAEKGLEATPHSYGSAWYTWPLMQRPIYYWVDQAGNSRIYLFGNVLTMWLSTAAVALLALIVLKRVISVIWKGNWNKIKGIELILLIGFLGNWLPFMLIHRVMFLYHYFSALIFAYLILVYEISLIGNKKTRLVLYGILILLAIIGYCYFYPLVYGLPLEYKDYMSKVWLKTWM